VLAWDEARQSFARALRRSGMEVRVLLVCEPGRAPAREPGMTVLHPGSVQAALAGLK
jgi:hypothetical protein